MYDPLRGVSQPRSLSESQQPSIQPKDVDLLSGLKDVESQSSLKLESVPDVRQSVGDSRGLKAEFSGRFATYEPDADVRGVVLGRSLNQALGTAYHDPNGAALLPKEAASRQGMMVLESLLHEFGASPGQFTSKDLMNAVA